MPLVSSPTIGFLIAILSMIGLTWLIRNARAALTKSGTSTLELALAGVPMAAAYKVPRVEEAVERGAHSG